MVIEGQTDKNLLLAGYAGLFVKVCKVCHYIWLGLLIKCPFHEHLLMQ